MTKTMQPKVTVMRSFELDLGAEVIAHASWDQVKSGIGKLDGDTRNFLRFGHLDASDGEKDQYMIVQRSVDGRYMIVIQEGKRHFGLVETRKVEGKVMVKTDGIANSFLEDRFHDLATILEVAKTYFDEREKDSRFQWGKGAGLT
jgi:hypothetical protein